MTYSTATDYSGTYFVQGYETGSNAQTEFDINAASSGFYNVNLRYSSPLGNKSLKIFLNGPSLEPYNLASTANGNTWANVSTIMFLTQGINRNAYGALSDSGSNESDLSHRLVELPQARLGIVRTGVWGFGFKERQSLVASEVEP